MIQNTFTDVDKQESYVGTEPVSLAEVKAHLRVDFTDDDTMLTAMITAARQAIEDYCHISLVSKTVTLTLESIQTPRSIFTQPFQVQNSTNSFELPYGPVQAVSLVTSIGSDGVTVTTLVLNADYFITGKAFKTIKLLCDFQNFIMVYVVGYAALPGPLRLAILNEIAYRYESRGEPQNISRATAFTKQGVCLGAQVLADPYKRLTSI